MATEISNNIVDISLSAIQRKPIRIDGDDSRIVYIDTSDMGLMSRIHEVYPKLKALQQNAADKMTAVTSVEDADDESAVEMAGKIADTLNEIDGEMRELIDFLFDAPVSEVAAPSGYMYDVFNGSFRYDYIITAFLNLYTDNLQSEYKKIKAQVSKHTKKYTNK